VLTTDEKGAIAEAAIALAALELGIAVSKPIVERPYDLIFELEQGLVRVQCKWAVRYGDVITVRCYGGRRNADGLLRRFYSSDEIEAFAAYCAELRRCLLLSDRRFSEPARYRASSLADAQQPKARNQLGGGL
jgi:hypothetical protein